VLINTNLVGVGEVRHLCRAGTTHYSGEPREEDVATRLEGGSAAPMGSPEPVAQRGQPLPPKSPPSPLGEVEAVRLGAPPVQERADQLVVEAKARPALCRSKTARMRSPSTKRARGRSPAACSLHQKMKININYEFM
jgi:hypothetical protein